MTDQHLSVISSMDAFMAEYGDQVPAAVDLAIHGCETFCLYTPIGGVPKWLLAAAKMIWEIYHEQPIQHHKETIP